MRDTPFAVVIFVSGGVVQGVYANGPMHDLATFYLQDADEEGPAEKIDVIIDPDTLGDLLEELD